MPRALPDGISAAWYGSFRRSRASGGVFRLFCAELTTHRAAIRDDARPMTDRHGPPAPPGCAVCGAGECAHVALRRTTSPSVEGCAAEADPYIEDRADPGGMGYSPTNMCVDGTKNDDTAHHRRQAQRPNVDLKCCPIPISGADKRQQHVDGDQRQFDVFVRRERFIDGPITSG